MCAAVRGAAQSAELRRHARLAVDLGVRRKTRDGAEAAERVLNLSTGGLAIATGEKLPPGSLEQLVISAADGSFEAELQAEVMRLHGTQGAGEYVAGLRFRVLDAATAAKIEQLMVHALSAPSGKRTGPRLEVRHEVFWSSGGFTGAASFELMNVSTTGALLFGAHLPAPNTLGLLSLRADGSDDLLAVPAQVVWRRSEGDGQLAGVRFGQDPSAALLVRRILQRLLFHHPRTVEATSVGTRIGEYELGRLLFRGQALEVYQARGPAGDVALKRFCGNPAEVAAWTERFLAAARLGPSLNHHPGIVRVHAAIADAEECWLATELVEGESLEQRLIAAAREGGKLPLDEVLAVARDVLATLEDCHSYILDDDGHAMTVLHGDLRPSNVLLGTASEPARLTGFGSAFDVRPERLAWLPPEALEGRPLTPQSDVFQVGVLLYEALAGVLPFRADSLHQLSQAIVEGAAPIEGLSPALDALVRSALAAAPSVRPASAAAFAESLARIDLVAAATEPEIEITEAPVEQRRPRRLPKTAPPPDVALGPGERVGRYQIIGKLGEGGMAELFIARAPETAWPVVLKTILPARARDGEIVSLFMNEARLVSQIEHPNVVRITDIGFDRLSPFIAMEYFPSRTLADVMLALDAQKLPMPVALAAYVVAEAAAGLECAHSQRDAAGKPLHIVHRDVTAKNLLLGYGGAVKVADFGIARAAGMARLTSPGTVRGTASFVSPEQVSGAPVTPATDVWGLGVNLYLMLAGTLPFKGNTDVAVLEQVVSSEPVGVRRLRPDVPAGLAELLPRALAKSPVERYPSAADLREEAIAFVPDAHECAASMAMLLDTLFPRDSDPERMRAAALAPEESMPGDASSPLKRLMGWLRK